MSTKMLQRIHKLVQRRSSSPAQSPLDEGLAITIRFAYPDDASALHHLAALDSQTVPQGPLLVAEVGGELWAAVAIDGQSPPLADPFRHTAALVELLRERAERLSRPRPQPAAPHPTPEMAWR
jgi:hypothetical protein